MEKSKTIFGNPISSKVYKKACRTKCGFEKKFGNDCQTIYPLKLIDNPVLTDQMNVKQLVMCDPNEKYTKLELPENAVIIGNIRMGFGHYRISMAMASAANALGFTPVWMDLNSFTETTATKIISAQNNLYSLGSRLSQKYRLFNKLVWEPLNYEGFKKLSYNACDQKTSELMTALFHDIPKDTPFIATHVWPAQAAVHAGMRNVINAIPDNWPMALHLSEGALHAVQTQKTYWGYRYLTGFDGTKILNPMKKEDIIYTGHYIDDELVKNLEADCKKRIIRSKKGEPVRFLLTVGGAGAQGEFFAEIIKVLLPYVKEGRACLYINCGDYMNVWDKIKANVPKINEGVLRTYTKTHFDDWNECKAFAQNSLTGKNQSGNGIHVFCNKDIFAAVYITNLLMRACDVLITKPSELAFYPVPKLFIKRIGGHEKWGAIHSNELGDGTPECQTPAQASQLVKGIIEEPELMEGLCNNILIQNSIGTYNGAFKVVEAVCKSIKTKSKKRSVKK